MKRMSKYAKFNNIEFWKVGKYYANRAEGKQLHVYIYEYYHKCSILKGNDVHHLDENTENNDISNLQLLTHREHIQLHNKGAKNCMFGKKHLDTTKQKMKKPKSEDHKKKISESKKGNKCRFIECSQEMIQDVKNNNITCKNFCSKYNLSGKIFYRIKKSS